jgi:hypothetical protein
LTKEKPCKCEKLECPICWDYSTHGFCGECNCPLGIADFDWGECPRCGNKEIKVGLQ